MAHPPQPSAEPTVEQPTAARRERPPPARHSHFDHLALEELRAYRDTLAQEETQVSYQRRVLQLTLAEAREGRSTAVADSAYQRALELSAGRTAILDLVPADGLPALPNAEERQVPSTEPASRQPASVIGALTEADRQLAAYQESVRVRIAAATTELIARYRERPTLAVRALPLTPVIHPREPRY